MIYTVRNCRSCGLPDITRKWVIVSTTIQFMGGTGPASRALRQSVGRIDYQGDDKAELGRWAKKLQIRGGACCVEDAGEIDKCRCEESDDE